MGEHSRGWRWVWAARVRNGTGDRVLPGSWSSVMEQKAQATVPMALPCSKQRLNCFWPGM